MLRDLCILWEWEHDERFVKLLDSLCYKAERTSYLISSYNLGESLEKIECGELSFRVVLDRATDCNADFKPVLNLLQKAGSRIINEPERAAYANNKEVMHLELMRAGLNIPYTVMLYPSERLEDKILDSVGIPFVIKPAEGGGGEGVVLGAETMYEVVKARERHSGRIILIQEEVIPREFEGTRCWFRVFFMCRKIIPCFWNDQTHIYRRLTPHEERFFGELIRIAEKIRVISGLEFFSTEVAQKQNGKFIVVDYVNDQCDMRFQSDTPDGVPDSVIEEIARALVCKL